MGYKEIRLSTLFLLGLGLTGLQAQNALKVKEKSGTETSYNLDDIRKLTFLSGNLIVSKTDGIIQMYTLSNIRFLDFGNAVTSIDQYTLLENSSLQVYPNPVIDEFTFTYQFANKGSFQIDIFDLQGKVVLTKTESHTEGMDRFKINVSKLPKGLYLCRLLNGSSIETRKFLKN
ncbi:MAG: T9SS type A sorting domain-containing protein [Bacteroidales bacterium]|jgi:hypothetical protein|nr:T9SS type A sorting domain-containing protein [Bacteroidales bacterium]